MSGLLLAQHFSDGQTVKKGDLLFTIDPDLFQVAVDTAQAEVARTGAQLDFAREDFERAQALVRNGSVTARDLDQRQAPGDRQMRLSLLQTPRCARPTQSVHTPASPRR